MSPKALIEFDLAEYRLLHHNCLRLMRQHRNYCMQLLSISEEDMKEFAERQVIDDIDALKESDDSLSKAWSKDYLRHMDILIKARKQYSE